MGRAYGNTCLLKHRQESNRQNGGIRRATDSESLVEEGVRRYYFEPKTTTLRLESSPGDRQEQLENRRDIAAREI